MVLFRLQRYTVCFSFHSFIKGCFYEIEFTENKNISGIYLTTVIDIFAQKVIGSAISYSMSTEESVPLALRMGVKNRKTKAGAIFYSDRGVQYACKKT